MRVDCILFNSDAYRALYSLVTCALIHLYFDFFLNYGVVITSPYCIFVIRISSSLLLPPRLIVAYTSFNHHQLITYLRRLFYSYGVALYYFTKRRF